MFFSYALFVLVYGYKRAERHPLKMVLSLHYVTTISLSDIIGSGIVLVMYVYNAADKNSLVVV